MAISLYLLVQAAGVAAADPARPAAPAAAQFAGTDAGILQGASSDGLTVYKGVPYAAPPLGDLRWREPQAVNAWSGVRPAKAFAPACPQKGVSMPGETPPATREDCLYLNIWAPMHAGLKPLPVIAWIHGGGYSNGSASMPLYWGDRLARKGVIVVTIAYRLGPLGFLAHPTLTSESTHHSSGNYGLLDQIAALEWIQRNIAAFGGDPRRVTVAGQSAGSMAVSALMASPRAKGLFQRAIGESGGLFEPLQLAPSYSLAGAEHEGESYLTSLHASSLEQLRKLPVEELLGGTAGAISHPVIEPYALPESPYDVFAAGRQNDVPLLLGSNAEEARSLAEVASVKAQSFVEDVQREFGPLPPTIFAAYPHATDKEARQARLDLERDLRFAWDMWAWARAQAHTGKSAVYYYSFRQRPPFPTGSVYQEWGAGHFTELWYVFDHLDQERWKWRASDRTLAETLSSYWANFAKRGDPNGHGLPRWLPFKGEDGAVQVLGDPISTGSVPNIDTLKIFDSAYGQLRH